MAKTSVKKLITPFFRVSYPNVFRAKRNDLNGKDEFSIVMLFDKKNKDELKAMKAAAAELAREKWGAELPKNLRSPFRDGDIDKPDNDSFRGQIFVTARSTFQPGLVDAKKQEIISEDEFYGGCYARAEVSLYAYDMKGNRGIGVGLQNIQKQKDGQPFGNRSKAEDAFSPVETDAADDAFASTAGETTNDPFG